MLSWFKKSRPELTSGKQCSQPPGEVFPWPKGWQLTAVDEVILVLPAALIDDRETIGSVIHCHEDARISLPTEPQSSTEGARIMVWLKPGQSVWLSKSCQATVAPNGKADKMHRRFHVVEIAPQTEP
jgi:hypothetical protein